VVRLLRDPQDLLARERTRERAGPVQAAVEVEGRATVLCARGGQEQWPAVGRRGDLHVHVDREARRIVRPRPDGMLPEGRAAWPDRDGDEVPLPTAHRGADGVAVRGVLLLLAGSAADNQLQGAPF